MASGMHMVYMSMVGACSMVYRMINGVDTYWDEWHVHGTAS